MRDNYLKFEWEHIGPILNEQKAATVRYELERDIPRGEGVSLRDPDGDEFATAEVIRSEMVRLQEVMKPIKGVNAPYPHDHAGEVMMALWEHYDRSIGPEDPVTVLIWDNTEKAYGE